MSEVWFNFNLKPSLKLNFALSYGFELNLY